MGTIADKLNYLLETVRLLKDKISSKGDKLPEDITTRELANAIDDMYADGKYILDAMRGENPKIHIYDDVYITPDQDDMICPRIVYDSDTIEDGTIWRVLIPFSYRGRATNNTTVITGAGASYHNVKVRGDRITTSIALCMVKPNYLVLPDNVNLVQYSLFNGSSGTDINSFTNGGLIFGKRVYGSVASWINRSASGTGIKVYFPDGFQMTEGKTLYLSKLTIKDQECLQNMVRNLYDYASNGDASTRTINLGSSNLALLTDAEIETAKAKGWNLT